MRFTVRLAADGTAEEALGRLLDLGAHTRVIPFTTVEPALTYPELGPGTRFVARTAVGRLGFDDPMVVESIERRRGWHRIRLRKKGRAIRGVIVLEAVTGGDGRSVLAWRQDVRLPWWPTSLHWLAVPILRVGYRRILRALLSAPPASGHPRPRH